MSDIITLKGGLCVRSSAIALGISLENRGHRLSAADGSLRVTRGSELTDSDRQAIIREKSHLLALAAYVAPEGL